jgi:hypothetical protein
MNDQFFRYFEDCETLNFCSKLKHPNNVESPLNKPLKPTGLKGIAC